MTEDLKSTKVTENHKFKIYIRPSIFFLLLRPNDNINLKALLNKKIFRYAFSLKTEHSMIWIYNSRLLLFNFILIFLISILFFFEKNLKKNWKATFVNWLFRNFRCLFVCILSKPVLLCIHFLMFTNKIWATTIIIY